MVEKDPEQIADHIQRLAEAVDNPDDWKIIVPLEIYSDVLDLLDTTNEICEYYRGVTLCYGEFYDETQVELRAGLSACLDTLDAGTGGGSET